jgi:hypothetical protein
MYPTVDDAITEYGNMRGETMSNLIRKVMIAAATLDTIRVEMKKRTLQSSRQERNL